MHDDTTVTELRDVAVAAARAGGAAALAHFRRPGLAVEWKADASPVTMADRGAEAVIRDHLARALPADGWLGEETGGEEGTSGRRWIVDPIDGTRNFVRGIPLWATLVACESVADERILASAVALPALGEYYDAALGAGARCRCGDGPLAPVRVSGIDRLDDALWCFETPAWFRDYGLGRVFDQLDRSTHLQRGLCDAYGHVLIASGRAEVIVEPSLKCWDLAATSLLVREAGGAFSDLNGRDCIRSGNAVYSNGVLHQTVLDLVAAHRDDGDRA